MAEFAGLIEAPDRTPFYTQERCHISEWLNTEACAEVSLAECRVAAGVTTQLHRLGVQERYVVQQGSGLMELDGSTFALSPGDVVLIPAGCAQRVQNLGDQELVFLCVCTPRFEPHHYEVLEHAGTPQLEQDL